MTNAAIMKFVFTAHAVIWLRSYYLLLLATQLSYYAQTVL